METSGRSASSTGRTGRRSVNIRFGEWIGFRFRHRRTVRGPGGGQGQGGGLEMMFGHLQSTAGRALLPARVPRREHRVFECFARSSRGVAGRQSALPPLPFPLQRAHSLGAQRKSPGPPGAQRRRRSFTCAPSPSPFIAARSSLGARKSLGRQPAGAHEVGGVSSWASPTSPSSR